MQITNVPEAEMWEVYLEYLGMMVREKRTITRNGNYALAPALSFSDWLCMRKLLLI